MFTAFVFICSMAVARIDCSMDTARAYEQAHGAFDLPFACIRAAQMLVADPENKLVPRDNEYLKVSCTHHMLFHAG